MEKVTIREASQRLRISTASVRECIRGGELKAYRGDRRRRTLRLDRGIA